jgi:AraC-like DNA-binding protein
VALATGFTSPSSFARAFRVAHGTSARELRQMRNTPEKANFGATGQSRPEMPRPTTH